MFSPAWSSRAARIALGNTSPSKYAKGTPSTLVGYTHTDTPCGGLYAFFSLNERLGSKRIHAIVFDDEAEIVGKHSASTQKAMDETTIGATLWERVR